MTFRPLMVGVDLNRVVLNTLWALHRLSCKISGAEIPLKEFAGKNCVGKWFPAASGVGKVKFTAEHYTEAKREFFETKSFYAYAVPLPRAVETIQRIYADGHRITLVTDVLGLPESFLERWWHESKLPRCEMVLTRGETSKSEQYNYCDMVVDNDHKHLKLLSQTEICLLHMLPCLGAVGSAVVSRPRGLPNTIISVRGWNEVYEHLCKMKTSVAA